ncbi:hypothetical protein CS063_01420 [Sporanaerobium hydrogeniformans]|uniref:Uncharacterized protein n=1 Tax=Sporanaerobium hydrogeniformans TaxID=3072179 RepID=A0AC61DGX4_9FIRM|nr:hypothetical protein [Sporanaerobium hydrogeniformans]PHV72162.1 hypothetical protein CS063_01420 [Sporanaerobium hydrogeniformans]
MKEKNEIAVIKFEVPALPEEIVVAMAEEMDGLEELFDFDRIKIPSGGGLAFEVPGEDEENPDVVKEIKGVIVDHHPINAYWPAKYEGANQAPECSSMDGKVGSSGRNCKNCPHNKFGSDGNGKACKNMHRVYVLTEGSMFPQLLTLPPSSLKNISNFIMKQIIMKGHKSSGVIVKITLKKATNANGIVYSQAVFTVDSVLDTDTAAQMASYSQMIKEQTRKIAITDIVDEYVSSDGVPAQDSEPDDMPF